MKLEEQNEEVKMLVDLGLTNVQAKTFLAVAELREAPIKLIAKASNMARQNIYQTMLSLQDLGLVEKILETPVKYRAIPLKNAAKILFDRKTQEYNKLKAETEELEKKSDLAYIYPEDNHEFVLIPQKEGHWRRVEEALKNAQKSVHTIMTYSDESKALEIKDLPKSIQDAIARGVKVKVISNQPMKRTIRGENLRGKSKGSYEVRFLHSSIPVMFCSIDEKDVFIATEPACDPNATGALWTRNPGLIMVIEEFFHSMWRKSEIALKS